MQPKRSERPQRLLILDLLEILRKYSDRKHPLTQKQIREYLPKEFREYDTSKIRRRETIKDTLQLLKDTGEYPVYCAADVQEDSEDEAEDKKEILTNLFYQHPLDSKELCLLIDGIMFMSGLSGNSRKELVQKLKGLSSVHFSDITKHSDWEAWGRVENPCLPDTSEILHRAIADGKQVSFQYCHCDMKFKLQPRKNDDGSVKTYVVSPYQLVTANGRPYLVCRYGSHQDLSHFRLDRIQHIRLLKDEAVQVQGRRLSEYLTQHPNMWGGEAISVTFLCPTYLMNDVADWFGTTANILKHADGRMKVIVKVSEASMLHWALQYADCVEVVKPDSLRKQIADVLQEALKKYQ